MASENGFAMVEETHSPQLTENATSMIEDSFVPPAMDEGTTTHTNVNTEVLEDHESDSNQQVSETSYTEHDENPVNPNPNVDSTELETVQGADLSILSMEREQQAILQDESMLLDAAFAEFGNAKLERILKDQPELHKKINEVVIGRDDRIRMNNTTAFPWRCICSLSITAADGSKWIGTGFLVGPRLVVTAGHVVYMHNRGGWAKSIEVIPGRNGSRRPYGSCKSSFYYSVKGWTQKRKREYDYAAIVLPSDCKFGNQLGYFGYGYYSKNTLKGRAVNLSGYPGDKTPGTQWWHARKLTDVNSKTLVYNIDTAGGQSGAPVWQYKNGQRYAVGIHTNGHSSGNSATRITKEVFNNIKTWKNRHQ